MMLQDECTLVCKNINNVFGIKFENSIIRSF